MGRSGIENEDARKKGLSTTRRQLTGRLSKSLLKEKSSFGAHVTVVTHTLNQLLRVPNVEQVAFMHSISVPSITDEQKDRWKADERGAEEGKGRRKAGSTHPIIRVNSLGTQMEKSRNKRLQIPCNSRSNGTSDLSASRGVIGYIM